MTAAPDSRSWKLLVEEEDVTDEILEHALDCLDWFQDRKGLSTQDFIDRLAQSYGGSGYDPDNWDIDSYDNPAVRKIMRVARRAKREQDL